MSRTHYFTNHRNVPMLAVLMPTGGTYGLRRADGTQPLVADRPMIEFWDARYDHDAEYHAQFVQRYYVDTLAGTCGRATGLLLDTGSPDWTLSANDLSGVLAALL